MGENFVNRYVLVLGHGGLGGTGYEIHAKAEDLEALAQRLMERVGQFRLGVTPFQTWMAEQGLQPRADDSIPIFSEYITLSRERTDRTTFSFHIAQTLEPHHQMVRPRVSASSVGVALAKVLWFVVLPFIGIGACFASLVRAL